MTGVRSKLSNPPRKPDRGLAAGLRVNDNVVLSRPLGEGGMGSVWVARHETLKTDVAVKFIGEKLDVNDMEVLARFNREASTAAQIKSPYVVQTFDQGVMSSGVPYIVMELLEGEALEDRIGREGELSLEDTEVVVAETAKALAAAHARGIIHRDIKPHNIFLTSAAGDLHVKVFDFGIAKQTNLPALEGITSSGQPVGTPEFMSPEQLFDARNVDHRADLWSLAVVAYFCLTGRLPFEAETLPELCKLLLKGKHSRPSDHRPELTPAIDEWFEKALHASIDARFRSAKEMAVALVRVLAAARFVEETNAIEEMFITSEDPLPPGAAVPRAGSRASSSEIMRTVSPALVPVPAPGKRRRRRVMLWAAMALAGAVVLVSLVLHPEVTGLFDHGPQEAKADAAAPSASAASAPPPSTSAPVSRPEPSGGPQPSARPRPTTIDGKDANRWRSVLDGAAIRGDGAVAADAFVALATIDPDRFGEKEVMADAATAAHLASSHSAATGDRVFALLSGDALAHHAADILYEIVSVHGGSPAAKRAAELLTRPDVLGLATPALRIALAMRDAGCRDRPALFERAAADGDERTLYLLVQMRSDSCGAISCCRKDDARLGNAINQIRARAHTKP